MHYILALAFSLTLTFATAEVRPIGVKDGSIVLYVKGEIAANDAYVFKELLQLAKSTNVAVRAVYLDSAGGNVKAGYEIALLVRATGISSFVPSNSTCASSCFMVFMAGTNRFFGENVRIGVHSVSNSRREETGDAMSTTVQMSRFLKNLGTPPSIIGKLVTAQPSEIAWLSVNELQEVAKVVLAAPAKVADHDQPQSSVSPRNEVSISEKRQARDLNAEAITSLRTSNYRKAIPLLKKAAVFSPYDAEIQGNLGFAMYLARDYKNARDTLALALGLKSNRGSTWVNLGQTVSELGDLDWAITCFKNYLLFSSNKVAAIAQLQEFRDQQSGVISKAAAVALEAM